jgi:hypothetical protein
LPLPMAWSPSSPRPRPPRSRSPATPSDLVLPGMDPGRKRHLINYAKCSGNCRELERQRPEG